MATKEATLPVAARQDRKNFPLMLINDINHPRHLGNRYRLGEEGEWAMVTDENACAIYLESENTCGWMPKPVFYEDSGISESGDPFLLLPLWLFPSMDMMP